MCVDISTKDIIVPQVCRNSSVLVILIYGQLAVSIAFLIVSDQLNLEKYAFISVYMQVYCLTALFSLCRFRHKINALPKWGLVITVVFLLLLLGCCFEVVIYLVNQPLGGFQNFFTADSLARLTGILLLSLLILSFFNTVSVQAENKTSGVKSHYQALQARIRPHFLFNSLNTIAELTQVDKDSAEEAIQSLSQLFRASLGDMDQLHSMQDEVNLCKSYLQLERWRLGNKLSDSWHIQVEGLSKWMISKLMLQPLVENAVLHGAQEMGHVELKVDIRETETELAILVENKVGISKQTGGNGMAVDNIRSRLRFLYDDQHRFKVRATKQVYQVFIRIPKQKTEDYGSLI